MDDLSLFLDPFPANPDVVSLRDEPEATGTPTTPATMPPTEPNLPVAGFPRRTATEIAVVGPHAFYEQILLIRVNDIGAQVDNTGGIIARRVDCQGSDGLFHTLVIREIDVCVANGGGGVTNMKMMVLCSEPY